MNDKNLSRLYKRLEGVLDEIYEALDDNQERAKELGDEALANAYRDLVDDLEWRHCNGDSAVDEVYGRIKWLRKPSADGIGKEVEC